MSEIEIPQIRGVHRYAYRSGEWAELLGVRWHWVDVGETQTGRMCYDVLFAEPDKNGQLTDLWPVVDGGTYEFRNMPLS